MMASAVSICSNALLLLGDKPISSFSENTDRAQLCSNLWESARDSILRCHPWNCAIKRVSLSPEAVRPAFGFSHQFALPGDWLRNVLINDVHYEVVDHTVESGKLLMDGTTLNLRYIWRNTDPANWDAMLVEAAELKMAARLAYPITQSTTKQQFQTQLLEAFLRKARAVDGQDESSSPLGSSNILGARYS